MESGFGRIYLMISMIEMAESACNFPKRWHGRWFDSAATDVHITSVQFSNKGFCFARHREYYLVENRLEHCHQCLLISDRHENVIQYKQSYCIGRMSLQSICAQIKVGSVFFTLVREPAVPVPCPLQKSFHFVYSNSSLCYCRSPMSYLQRCSDETRMAFNFRRCRNCVLTFDQEMEFECLATWKDGPDHFALGAFLRLEDASVVYSYHCFKYHLHDSVTYIVMSTDISCHGFLRSTKQEQLTIELTEDTRPSLACHFPVWMTSITWHETSSAREYSFGSTDDVMIARLLTHRGDSKEKATAPPSVLYKCLAIHSEQVSVADDGESHIRALVQVIEGCNRSKFQCVRFRRRLPDLLQLEFGSYVSDVETNCSLDSPSHSHSSHLVVSSDLVAGPCPFTGRYLSRFDDRGCRVELRSGCEDHTRLTLIDNCQDNPDILMECVKWWSVGQKLFLLTRQRLESHSKHADSYTYHCHSFHSTEDKMEFSAEESCGYSSTTSTAVYIVNKRQQQQQQQHHHHLHNRHRHHHHHHHHYLTGHDNVTRYVFLYALAACSSENGEDLTTVEDAIFENQPKIIREISVDKEMQEDLEISPKLNHLSAYALSSTSLWKLNTVSMFFLTSAVSTGL